jgi:hypothetical protein
MSHPALHPWRVLILDRERGDPKFILATVSGPADVRPARDGDDGVDEVTRRWVATASGLLLAELTPMTRAHVWRVDEGGKPG